MNINADDAYQKVMDSLKEVASLRTFENLGTPQREDLDRAANLLDEISWKIVSKDISKFNQSISAKSKDLTELAKKMSQAYAELQGVAENIQAAAEAVGAVADAVGKAIGAGLL